MMTVIQKVQLKPHPLRRILDKVSFYRCCLLCFSLKIIFMPPKCVLGPFVVEYICVVLVGC